MVSLTALWLPIVVSAVGVFMASSIVHMVLKYHNSDYRKLPDEDAVATAMRGAAPGYYSMPHCLDMKEMGSPEMLKKYKDGPIAFVTVSPNGAPKMGITLGTWFVYCLWISVFVAYLAGRHLDAGADYMAVFRMASTVGFLGYGASEPIAAIWKAQPWSMTLKHVVDGLIYALVTGGIFGWLWPAAL